MKERPILMSAPMVRALLNGTKTQTRRAVKLPASTVDRFASQATGVLAQAIRESHMRDMLQLCPYGIPGDRLWVRETLEVVANWGVLFYAASGPDEGKINDPRAQALVEKYGDHYHANDGKRIPSIFMPRWASRITLEITDVRVERLQEISNADAVAEGIAETPWAEFPPIEAYKLLWNAINAEKAPWDANPWVWVVSFKRIGGGKG